MPYQKYQGPAIVVRYKISWILVDVIFIPSVIALGSQDSYFLIIITKQKRHCIIIERTKGFYWRRHSLVQETWRLCTSWISSCAMRISCFTFNISWCWRCWLRGISKYHIFFLEKQSKLSNLIFETAKIMAFQKTKLLFCIPTYVLLSGVKWRKF